MDRPRYSQDQIIDPLREAQLRLAQGEPLASVSKSLGISRSSYRRWRRKYGERAKEHPAAVPSEISERSARARPTSTEDVSTKEVKDSPNGKLSEEALGSDPTDLLDEANNASNAARNAWIAFLALLAYLLVTLGGVSHRDLFLNSGVTLPIVNVEIPLFSFFLLAPLLLLLVLLSLLIQHVVLARKYRRFVKANAPNEEHPTRERVHSYVVTQLLAGPKRNMVTNWLMRRMVFVTFAFLPVFTLLYFQIKFIPYHEVWVTYWHRIAVLVGLGLLFTLLPIILLKPRKQERRVGPKVRKESSARARVHSCVAAQLLAGPKRNMVTSWLMRLMAFVIFALLPILTLLYFQITYWHGLAYGQRIAEFIGLVILLAFLVAAYLQSWKPTVKLGPQKETWRSSPLGIAFGVTAAILVIGISWLVATVPDEGLDRFVGFTPPTNVLARPDNTELLNPLVRVVCDQILQTENSEHWGWLLLCLVSRRVLVVQDQDLVPNRDDEYNEVSIAPRERDLRFARLSRSDLHRADLTKADLSGAQMVATRLEKAKLEQAKLQGANLSYADLQGADLREAELQGANLIRAKLQDANLLQAKLQGAHLLVAELQGANLHFAQLQGANLLEAKLQRAHLLQAKLQGADLLPAGLQEADLSNAGLQGANLNEAELQDADLREAKLQGADMSEAALQGADLREAELQGANLSAAELQGADLREAELQGANLLQAKLQGADLSHAELQGANLSAAELQGADLREAELQGADLRFAELQGADLQDVDVWLASFPDDLANQSPAPLGVADLDLSPPTTEAKAEFKKRIPANITDEQLLAKLIERLDPILRDDPPEWEDEDKWNQYRSQVTEPPPDKLASFLAKLACGDRGGYIANSMAQRAVRYSEDLDEDRRQYAKPLASALLNEKCEGVKALSDETRAKLRELLSPG